MIVSLTLRHGEGVPTLTTATVCCPGCRQRVPLTIPHGLELHHHQDGTQCPHVWPPYVAGAPVPVRRARVTHGIPRR